MRRLLLFFLALAVLLVAMMSIGSVREATRKVVDAGSSVVQAGQDVVSAGKDVVDAGSAAVGTVTDTAGAAGQLMEACDLMRTAVDPGTSPEESAASIQQAVAIVDDVVVSYPNAPGIDQLSNGLAVAREALAADPTGQSLGITRSDVDSACSRIPSLP